MSPGAFYLAFQVLATAIGLAAGSFVNVCIARMPEDRSVVSPPSHCPACGHGIRPWDNLPLLSWLLLRGRCRDCGTAISPLYPVVEALVGVLALLLFRQLVPAPQRVSGPALAAWALQLAFVAMLIGTTYIDLRHYIIPDQFSIYAVPAGIGANLLLGALGHPGALSWRQSVAGAATGAAVLGVVMGAYWLVRREEGMGFGDVKLLAMIGAWMGPWAVALVVLISSVLGSVAGLAAVVLGGRGLRSQIPFGPFLALGAILVLFHGRPIARTFLPGLATLMGYGP